MKAVIVAGGRGERLRPLTDKIPKPMIKVNDVPILTHIINLLKANGIDELIMTLCYLPEIITSYYRNGKEFGIKIRYIYEDINFPLGTAGSIAEAKKYIKSTFIVTYGDILRELDIRDMIRFHFKNNAFATLNSYKRFGNNPKSMLNINEKGKLNRFIERPKININENGYVWANGSFYIFEPQIFKYITINKFSDFGKDIFPNLIKNKERVYAFKSNGYFIDIGSKEKLKKAEELFKSGKVNNTMPK